MRNRLVIAGQELPFTPLAFILEFLLPIIGTVVLTLILLRIVRSAAKRSKLTEETTERVVKIVRRIFKFAAWIAVILISLRFAGVSVVDLVEGILAVLNTPFIDSGDMRISVVTIIAIIPLLYFANAVGRWSYQALDKTVLSRMGVDTKQRFSIGNLVRYGVMVLFLMVGFSAIGISMTSLTALFAVFGVGLGFGLQSTVANFFAGLIIIVTRPIKQGDFIKVPVADGVYERTVIDIKMIYSVIHTGLNETIVIPNSSIVGNSVHNFSYNDPSTVFPVPIQVAYDTDLDRASAVLREIGQSCPLPLVKGAEVVTQIFSYDASGITLRMLVPLASALDKYQCRSYVHDQVWRRFRDEGIQFPYPQLDIHIKDSTVLKGAVAVKMSAGSQKE